MNDHKLSTITSGRPRVGDRTKMSDEEREWEEEVALHGVCTRIEPDLMFPNSRDREAIFMAKKICHECPVLQQCAARALAMMPRPIEGVWAATLVTSNSTRWLGEMTRLALGGKPLTLKAPTRADGYVKRPTNCATCDARIRAVGVKAEDDPSGIQYGARGECAKCYSRTKNREKVVSGRNQTRHYQEDQVAV